MWFIVWVEQHKDFFLSMGALVSPFVAFAVGLLAARWQTRAMLEAARLQVSAVDVRERRGNLEQVVRGAQECFRLCTNYRSEVAREFLAGARQVPEPVHLRVAQDVLRVSLLHVPEVLKEAGELLTAVEQFNDWVMTYGQRLATSNDPDRIETAGPHHEWREKMRSVSNAVDIIGSRCGDLATRLR
jgi:hypothetical protein